MLGPGERACRDGREAEQSQEGASAPAALFDQVISPCSTAALAMLPGRRRGIKRSGAGNETRRQGDPPARRRRP